MKRVLLMLAVASLVGCASNPQTVVPQTQPAPKAQNKYESYSAPKQVELKVPDWYIQPPENTAQSIFSAGEATGTQLGMVMQKAMLDADAKLAFQMKSQIEASIKSFKTDTGGKYGAESAEMLTRKITNATIIGHHKVDSQITQEGHVFRVFVLMRYPLGEANHLLEAETAAKMARTQAYRERQATKELREGIERNRKFEITQENRELGIVDEPQSKVAPVTVDEPKPAVTGTNAVTTKEGKTVELLDVDNAEYKQRRAEALAKPNAVIGQTVLR